MNLPKPPKIDNEFFCIINRDKPNLAALISSYIHKPKTYIPTFEFPSVTAEEFDLEKDGFDEVYEDEHQMTRERSRRFNIKVGNTIGRLGGCEYLIIAGLTDNQRSYLTFLENYNVITIKDASDVDIFLNSIVAKNDYLPCIVSNIIKCLPYALHHNLLLKIDENEEGKILLKKNKSGGVVVIEQNNKVSSVIAINYAQSIEASIQLVKQIELNGYEIRSFIEDWKKNKPNAFNDLSAEIYPNIEHIDFKVYEFATFFTDGVPYSLILKNCIPISHVNLRINPDFFVFNNIYFESRIDSYSAIVFSPEEFEDEETESTIKKLSENNLYVKPLVGENATVYNIENHVQHYPFSLLHLCSHGGEVEGSRIIETFKDSNGDEHIVEYDEVLGFGVNPYGGDHSVTSKILTRKFDGLDWGSRELNEAPYPHYVFFDMFRTVGKRDDLDRSNTIEVSGSCHLKCIDSIYQAMFHFLAADESPVIFNNTCLSSSDIADSFIGVGARGYIGTLWDVNNSIAKKTAEVFYDNLFEGSVLSALYKSLEESKSTEDENIYIFWGLHFSSIGKGHSISTSRKIILSNMLGSFGMWKRKLETTQNIKYKKSIHYILDWIDRTANFDFKPEFIEYSKRTDKK